MFHIAAVTLAAQHEARRNRVIALEPHRDPLQVVQAAQQQPGAGEQDHRDGDLRRYQRATQPAARWTHGAGRPQHAAPGAAQGGEESEQHAGEHGRGRAEQEHAHIDRSFPDTGQRFRRHGLEGAQQPERQDAPRRAARRREQQAFGEGETHQPDPRGAQGRAYGDLAIAAHRARQQQVGDVGAGDQQHSEHRAQQRERSGPRVAYLAVAHRTHAQRDLLAKLRRHGFQYAREVRLQRALRLLQGEPGAQAGEHAESPPLALARLVQGLGQQDIGMSQRGHREIGRQYACHPRGCAIDVERFADRGRVAGEAAAPQCVRDDGDARTVGAVFFHGERASRGKAHPQRVQEIGLHPQAAHAQGTDLGQIARDRAGLERRNGGEGTGVAAQLEIGVGKEKFVGVERRHHAGGYQPRLVAVGQGTEEDAIHRAEDGSGCADCDGGGQHRRQGEAGVAAQSAQRVAEVLERVLNPDRHLLLDSAGWVEGSREATSTGRRPRQG